MRYDGQHLCDGSGDVSGGGNEPGGMLRDLSDRIHHDNVHFWAAMVYTFWRYGGGVLRHDVPLHNDDRSNRRIL